jgi:hypothetical protein
VAKSIIWNIRIYHLEVDNLPVLNEPF